MSDEIFLQTIVINSPFRNNVISMDYNNDYSIIKRLIDWKRGNPYTYKSEDFEEIIQSDCLFARKFDASVDQKIVKKIKEHLFSGDKYI